MKALASRTLEGKRAVVIGSGAAGLAAAVALAVRGARVRVLEQAGVPGGRLVQMRLGEVAVDAGETFVTQPQALGQLFAMAEQRLSDFLDLKPVEPRTRFVLPDGDVFPMWTDPARVAEELAARDEIDARAWKRLLPRWEKLARAGLEHQIARPAVPGMRRLAPLLAPAAWRLWPGLLVPGAVDGWLRGHFRGPWVPEMFDFLAGRLGTSTASAPRALLPWLLLDLERGAWRIDGGFGEVRDALLRLCQLSKVGIVTDAAVERLDIDDGQVVRVRGEGFKPLRTDIVVAAIPPDSVAELLPRRDNGKAIRVPGARACGGSSRSAIVMIVRCRRTWEGMTGALPMRLVPALPIAERARQIDRWRVPIEPPVIDVHPLPGAADGETLLKIVVPAPAQSERWRWSSETLGALRRAVFERLEMTGFDRIAEHASVEVELTPAKLGHAVGTGDGALYGPSMTSRCGVLCRAPQVLRGVAGLYLAGNDAHPGPGLPLAVTSGMLAAEAAEDAALTPRTR